MQIKVSFKYIEDAIIRASLLVIKEGDYPSIFVFNESGGFNGFRKGNKCIVTKDFFTGEEADIWAKNVIKNLKDNLNRWDNITMPVNDYEVEI